MPTLSQLWQSMNQPVVPPVGQHLDDPALNRSPLEAQLRGFGAGALEGLRHQLTPANIALTASSGALRGLGTAGEIAAEALPSVLGTPGQAVVKGLGAAAKETPFMQQAISRYMNKQW